MSEPEIIAGPFSVSIDEEEEGNNYLKFGNQQFSGCAHGLDDP